MADIYFPDVMAALPEPRFVEPQSNTGVMAMGSALQSLTSVANNFRTKEMNVQKAQQMADALEREGLTQEANLYRSASESYQTNFFATPQENERFNQSLLNDTLKLLTNKQEREMREQALRLDAEYKQSMINNMRRDDARADERLRFEKEELQERAGEKADALAVKEQRNKILSLDATADNFRQQAAQDQKAVDELSSMRENGSLTQEEYARRVAPYIDSLNKSKSQLNSIQRTVLEIQGIDAPASQEPMLNVPSIRSREEKASIAKEEADRAFAKNPTLKEYTVPGVGTFTNPAYQRPATVTVRESTGPQGTTTSRTTESQSGTVKKLPPGLPKFNVNQLNLN